MKPNCSEGDQTESTLYGTDRETTFLSDMKCIHRGWQSWGLSPRAQGEEGSCAPSPTTEIAGPPGTHIPTISTAWGRGGGACTSLACILPRQEHSTSQRPHKCNKLRCPWKV